MLLGLGSRSWLLVRIRYSFSQFLVEDDVRILYDLLTLLGVAIDTIRNDFWKVLDVTGTIRDHLVMVSSTG